MRLPRRQLKRGRVEIIPMIDTILILLIFYMSFSTFDAREKRIDTRIPLRGDGLLKLPDVVLHVVDARQVLINGTNPMDLDSLKVYLRQLGAYFQDTTMVIEAEPTTAYADVIGVLDACALANLTKVAFRPLARRS